MTKRTVAIIGGGMGGMSAAHELLRLAQASGTEFDIHIYERSDALGGKSKSQLIDNASDDVEENGRTGTWPGEHGFRFFPAFYNHIVDTMRTTPCVRPDGQRSNIYDELQESQHGGVGADGRFTLVARPVKTTRQVLDAVTGMFANLDLQPQEMAAYGLVLLQFLSSCPERRLAEYDHIGWDDFIGAKTDFYSDRTRKLLLSIPGNLSAMKAHDSSSRTIGNTSLQVLYNFNSKNNQRDDAVLPAPTDLSWLHPWTSHLTSHGVKVTHGREWNGFQLDKERGRIDGARFSSRVADEGEVVSSDIVKADYYILAVPIEVVKRVIGSDPALAEFDAAFRNLQDESLEHSVRDMVGAQFFLSRDIAICKGHALYPFTSLALTSISQAQFWVHKPLAEFGVDNLKGILSVVISDWDSPISSGPNKGKTARELGSSEAVLDEVWHELVEAVHEATDIHGQIVDLKADGLVIHRHLCSQMVLESEGTDNQMPLLVHPKGAYARRPLAQTRAPNLFIASDYVRTHTDLASMESANEAARRAVRSIAYREGLKESTWPQIYPLSEHAIFAPGRALDEVLFRLGLPHIMSPALRAIFGRPRSEGEGLEATGRRSMDAKDYLEALRALDEGVASWVGAPEQEGFIADVVGGFVKVAVAVLEEGYEHGVLRMIREWSNRHPGIFDGSAFDAKDETALGQVVNIWESLLRTQIKV
jgi:uncharacterized protein with NAD-binding domain and iron-sulfur cluster